ncbi:flagellar protein FlaG [Rhodospirillaceae bacterium KN72]|uniref:Flagellar protein FlaG n=1 Tax=Pacificispira spongiicola TaxID=2729598 RepID=A0A7Y0E351_9PROT|nr:flagellar protein FlaG [Pacificispira spongiicola]NMM46349.1 flagellar protein FlaG [Pacificispira spongiicola]
MDVNLTSQVPLPQNNQSQQAPNATNQTGATATVQTVPDNVVTAATESAQSNSREEDALRRQERSVREQAVASLDDIRIEGLKTRFGFDAEKDRVFLEILLPKTEEVLRRIPSESLIEFLQSQVDRISSPGGSSQAFDQSI